MSKKGRRRGEERELGLKGIIFCLIISLCSLLFCTRTQFLNSFLSSTWKSRLLENRQGVGRKKLKHALSPPPPFNACHSRLLTLLENVSITQTELLCAPTIHPMFWEWDMEAKCRLVCIHSKDVIPVPYVLLYSTKRYSETKGKIY